MAFFHIMVCIVLQIIAQSSAQECKDDWNQCSKWATPGYCGSNPALRDSWCRLSCKVCTPSTPASGCQDLARSCDSLMTISNICVRNQEVRRICKKSCNLCPSSGTTPKWSKWSVYSSCSVTCGRGNRKRTRTCSVEGRCTGISTQTRTCKLKTCDKEPPKWFPWGKFGPCSVTCGIGQKTRVRLCSKENSCKGPAKDVKRCTRRKCRTKAYWGKWGAFGPCSVTCGSGQKKSRRVCIGGTSCKGPSENTNSCYAGRCPTKTTTSPPSNGWSSCTRTCGTGTQYKFDSSSCRYASNPRCFRTFRECNTNACPRASCYRGYEQRYGQDHSCCKLPAVGQRVLMGEEAKRDQWPWMVFLLSTRMEICGGTLIHQRWVLTAGHCVTRNGVRMKANEMNVHVGILRLSERSNANKFAVDRIIDNNYKTLQNDIALLRLAKPVKESLARPVDLPQGEVTPVDSICYATGWGLTSPNPPLLRPSDPLMEVSLQVLDLNVCQKAYQADPNIGNYVMTSNKLLCAGSLTKKNDVCRGDSGGPLVCQRCSSCDWYIAGITSFGPKGTCGKQGSPGMFTKVSAFESWIRSKVPGLPTFRESCP